MRKMIFFLLFIGVLAFVACETTPTIPVAAHLVLDSALARTMTVYDRPQFEGYIKNDGNNIAYKSTVEIICYSDSAKSTIIDTATGYPAGGGDIPPGSRIAFHAVTLKCTSHDQIKSMSTKITWLNKQ